MAICLGCRREIDTAFDTPVQDDRGRPWHPTCHANTQRPSHWRAIGEVAIWLVCWPWGLARWIGRMRGWSSAKANAWGLGGFVLGVVIAIAVQGGLSGGAAPAPPALGAGGWIEETVRADVEKWLTTNSPVGTTAAMEQATCEEVDPTTFKCAVSGELTAEEASERGHMTVAVTTDGDTYQWQMTEGWTPEGS